MFYQAMYIWTYCCECFINGVRKIPPWSILPRWISPPPGELPPDQILPRWIPTWVRVGEFDQVGIQRGAIYQEGIWPGDNSPGGGIDRGGGFHYLYRCINIRRFEKWDSRSKCQLWRKNWELNLEIFQLFLWFFEFFRFFINF